MCASARPARSAPLHDRSAGVEHVAKVVETAALVLAVGVHLNSTLAARSQAGVAAPAASQKQQRSAVSVAPTQGQPAVEAGSQAGSAGVWLTAPLLVAAAANAVAAAARRCVENSRMLSGIITTSNACGTAWFCANNGSTQNRTLPFT